MSLDNALAARVVAGFLKAGRVLDGLSSVLLLGTLLLARQPASPLFIALLSTALGLAAAAKYLAWRVALDAEFFALLHEYPARTGEFDAALAAFLARPAPVAGRPLASRCRGARRLAMGQAIATAAQLAAVVALATLA